MKSPSHPTHRGYFLDIRGDEEQSPSKCFIMLNSKKYILYIT